MNFQATINGQTIGYSLVKLFPPGPDINGQWFNSGHDGEGFFLTEDSGRLIGAYFTHDGQGFPTWFTFDCLKSGDIYTGPVYLTQGGEMGVPHDPLESVEVGAITFSESVIVEPPSPDPDPEPPTNPFEGKLTFRIKPFKHPSWLGGSFMQSPDGTWFLIWSKPQIPWGRLATGKNIMFQLEITALEDLSLSANAHGYGSPKWEGVPNTIAAGSSVEIKCVLTKGARPSSSADADYQLNINGITAVLLTEHITQST